MSSCQLGWTSSCQEACDAAARGDARAGPSPQSTDVTLRLVDPRRGPALLSGLRDLLSVASFLPPLWVTELSGQGGGEGEV